MTKKLLFALFVLFAMLARASARGAPAGGDAPPGDRPAHAVVVELFTSQGCMTCPPADRVLSAMVSSWRGA